MGRAGESQGHAMDHGGGLPGYPPAGGTAVRYHPVVKGHQAACGCGDQEQEAGG